MLTHRKVPSIRLLGGVRVVTHGRELRWLEKSGDVQGSREGRQSRQRDGQLPYDRAGTIQQSQRGDAHAGESDLQEGPPFKVKDAGFARLPEGDRSHTQERDSSGHGRAPRPIAWDQGGIGGQSNGYTRGGHGYVAERLFADGKNPAEKIPRTANRIREGHYRHQYGRLVIIRLGGEANHRSRGQRYKHGPPEERQRIK